MKVKSTKAWHKLPCAHAQWFHVNDDGTPGNCASWHGYDRSVIMTFAGRTDEMGWVVPFGGLKKVKEFVEYYFDHTALIPANDPRVEEIIRISDGMTIPLFKYRVLPYGVSMEMSSLFVWEQVNPYILDITDGRCYLEKVEMVEHDSNSAFIIVTEDDARRQARSIKAVRSLIMMEKWPIVEPKHAGFGGPFDPNYSSDRFVGYQI